ncbi:HTH-type transcriptional regulator CysL [Roseovarius sp. THAF8]|uniref:LysR family transcriptional regulator n=1 Tax=Roseovarius sp. THAF8 TaxID=2587846 RepID=UPI0012696DBA|nr:LysR family transcriptional regulator [Roseovarius sp. THAF8]QFT98049.1 HTH-type transcriptional regulator CysL [Roseovarius sp. THAF8]
MVSRISDIDWSLVRAFLAVAEKGSLSAAGRLLGTSQPTLGRQVRQLEDLLGQVLFHRKPKGLELTANGQSLLEPARNMHRAMIEIELTAAGQQTEATGTVRITASDTVSVYILPPILAALHADHPGIRIDVVPSDSSENLLFREADIAVRMYRPEQLELVARHLGDFPLGLFASGSYLRKAGRPRTIADVFDHPVIGYDRNEEIIRGMQERNMPASRDMFAFRCDSHTVGWEMVRAGCGVGFGMKALGALHDDVEDLDFDIDLPSLPVWLATHQALRHTPRIAVVWEALAKGLKPHLS